VSGLRSSAGGAAAAAGLGFESRILAWFASHLIARVPLPASWRISAAQVEEIGGQTGQEMDDIGAITDRGGYVFIQAKLRLQLGETASSPLAEAFDQAVRQFIDGAPPSPDGTRRRLEPGRDALVICTDAAASASIRNDLRAVVTRLAGHPQELPLDQVATNSGERRALKVLLTHLRGAFAKRANGTPPTEEQLREIGRFLHVITLDVESGGAERIVAETHLRGVLDDPATAPGAWNDLVTLGQALLEERRWANRADVRQALASGGHPAGIDPPFRHDAQRLRDITRAALDANAREVTIPAPEGAVAIQRDVADLLARADGDFALIGEPGAGKTVLAVGVAGTLLDAAEDVVFLGAESLAGSLGATRTELAMQNNLDQVLRGWDSGRRGTLIVDGIDATRGTSSVDWIPALARSLRGTRWRILATIRTFDLRYGPSWQEMFPGKPIDARHADQAFSNVRHVLVGDLTESEFDQVRRQSPRLAELADAADPRLAGLLRNPFNLRLAADLIDDGDDTALSAVRTRQELLHLYWQRRVELTPDRLARRRAVRELCEKMMQMRRARIADPSDAVDPAVFGAVDALLRDGVLREDVQGRRPGVRPVVFSHPVLYDFAVAVTCLRGEDHLHLSRRLAVDPDLAITVRPSLDMHFADIWTDDITRGPFWDLAVTLSERGQGHPIAAVAAASAVLREHPSHDDLEPLERQAASSGSKGQAARMCVAHLAAALEAAEVSEQDRRASAPALAELAATLAAGATATGDIGLADLARALLLRLDHCSPIGPGAIAAETRSRAIADVMRSALSNPSGPTGEELAMRTADALAKAVVVSPGEVGPVIDTVIAPAVMVVWGGRVADRLIQHLGTVAEADPGLAQRLALSVWDFDDQRDEVTGIGGSRIIGLTSTRKQDLEMARYSTGEKFPAFLAASPETALQFLIAVIDGHAPPSESPRATGQFPRVYRAPSLEFTAGHGALNAMAGAFASFLVSLASEQDPIGHAVADQLMQIAAARLTHHQVWCVLLEAGAANPGSLGRYILALLDSSDLLGHYTTRPYAAKLTAALSAVLTAPEHARLEQAVLRARDPRDPDGQRTQDLVDSLLGQLDSSRVQDAAALARLAELDSQGGPPPAPEAPDASGSFPFVRDISFEWSAESSTSTEAADPLREALKRAETDLYGTMSGTAGDQRAARERLRESMPALYSDLIAADTVIDQSVFTRAFALLAQCAERLAPDAEVLPGTDLGEMVFEVLRAALPAGNPSGGGT
jgi:hypothetical protein